MSSRPVDVLCALGAAAGVACWIVAVVLAVS